MFFFWFFILQKKHVYISGHSYSQKRLRKIIQYNSDCKRAVESRECWNFIFGYSQFWAMYGAIWVALQNCIFSTVNYSMLWYFFGFFFIKDQISMSQLSFQFLIFSPIHRTVAIWKYEFFTQFHKKMLFIQNVYRIESRCVQLMSSKLIIWKTSGLHINLITTSNYFKKNVWQILLHKLVVRKMEIFLCLIIFGGEFYALFVL